MGELPAPHLIGMAELAQNSLAINMHPEKAKRFRDGQEPGGRHI
jgi:hypothetical protein